MNERRKLGTFGTVGIAEAEVEQRDVAAHEVQLSLEMRALGGETALQRGRAGAQGQGGALQPRGVTQGGQQMVVQPRLRSRPVLVESDTQRTLAVTVDLAAMTMSHRPLLAAPGCPVKAQCLWRDAQGLLHLFVVGKEGIAEQWLLRGDAAPLSRRQLSLPPGTRRCQADDAAGWLYVTEPGIGLWACGRCVLARPWGRLEDGVATFAVLPAGVAMLDGTGRALHLIERRDGKRWARRKTPPAGSRGDAEAMYAAILGSQVRLSWRDDCGWTRRRVAWSRAADAGMPSPLPVVPAPAQTEPVSRAGDAADDPAIWVHPTEPARSRILGTNKREGLHVYVLSGRELQKLPVGRLNNVDLRQRVTPTNKVRRARHS